jgi:RNA polymerase sigma-70 factor (ECF subfamily)
MEEDADLLAAVCDGSERAFNTLIDRHQQAVRVFLRGIAGREDADDIAQETFLAAWTHARSFRGQSSRGQASVRSWLFSIAWRKAKGAQRGWFRRRERDTAYHEASTDQSPSAPVEDRHAIQQALAVLSLDQKAVVMLCLAHGFTQAEAADALDMPLGTVKSHVTRGRERLREVLGEEG